MTQYVISLIDRTGEQKAYVGAGQGPCAAVENLARDNPVVSFEGLASQKSIIVRERDGGAGEVGWRLYFVEVIPPDPPEFTVQLAERP